jgi:hypothetical protein
MSCVESAISGNVVRLKEAFSRGDKWDEYTTLAAVLFQHLDCLQFAVENGCPLNSQCIYASLDGGDIDIVMYLVKAKCPGYKEIPRILSECNKDYVLYGEEQRQFFTTIFKENARYHGTPFYVKIEETFPMDISSKERVWFEFVKRCNQSKERLDHFFDNLFYGFIFFLFRR